MTQPELPGPAEVKTVASAGLEMAEAGSVFIDTSTIDPETSRWIAARAEAHGVKFLDAPVAGDVTGAAARALTIMVGGKPEVLDRCRSTLDTLGQGILHLGAVGTGHLAKLCNQVLAGGAYAPVAETLVLAGPRAGWIPSSSRAPSRSARDGAGRSSRPAPSSSAPPSGRPSR